MIKKRGDERTRFTPTAFLVFLMLIALAAPALAQDSGSRFAVVIGNSEYSGLTPLRNPVNDATDMAAALKRLGFMVELLTNADLDRWSRRATA